jgi:hypothetical protein
MGNHFSRRSFLASSIAAGALVTMPVQGATTNNKRKKIALVGTACYKLSHTQHFLDRFLMGYTWAGGWHRPEVDLVALYIDQFPENDLARGRAKQFAVPIYPTVEEALTLGGEKLAVDGVVVIGEHGDYPKNDKGQVLYPRYKWFKQIVRMFETSGHSVPVFNDKHLSTEWSECAEMVADSKRLGFPLLAGSSLPVTWRMPAIDLPPGTPLAESLCACYGRPDSYDFHGLETAQCMSERRRGGEVGIKSVQALGGEKMWEHVAARENTPRLLVAALARSHNLPEVNGYPMAPLSFEWARKSFPECYGYFIEHRDGLTTVMISLLPGPRMDFNYAGLNRETGEITSCQMYLPMPEHGSTTADFFNPLVHYAERMFVDGTVPYPVERTLLTSGMTLAGVDSLHRDGKVVETPQMAVRYQASAKSTYSAS